MRPYEGVITAFSSSGPLLVRASLTVREIGVCAQRGHAVSRRSSSCPSRVPDPFASSSTPFAAPHTRAIYSEFPQGNSDTSPA